MNLPTSDLNEIVRNTPAMLELRNSRIFITGGTGWFGKWFMESFAYANRELSLNAEMVCLTRHEEAISPDPSIRMLVGDVRDFDFPDGKFTHVIYAAADPYNLSSTPIGTQRCLDFATASGVKRFLYVSSGAARFNDDDYAQSKLEAEDECLTWPGSVSIARCFAFIGPGMPLHYEHYATVSFLKNRLAGSPIEVKGDGRAIRSYMYMTDLMTWLWTILIRGGDKRTYNVGSESGMMIRTLAELIATIEEPKLEVRLKGKPSAPSTYVPVIHECERELGLTIRIPITEALHRTIDWHRA